MDTFSPSKRSWIMAQVKSRGNKSTEQNLIEMLRKYGLTGWRRGYDLLGKPDFVFPKARVAIFVDGVFWHGHPQKCRMPKSNHSYWNKKITRNVIRDRYVTHSLEEKGWRVIRIWEDAILKKSTLVKLQKALG